MMTTTIEEIVIAIDVQGGKIRDLKVSNKGYQYIIDVTIRSINEIHHHL